MKNINCSADFQIFQINDRVFQIGIISKDSFSSNFPDLVNQISDILNLGLNFVPRYFLNKFDFYSSLFDNFENFLKDFNKKFDLFDKIFKKLKFQKINSDSIEYPLTSATIDMEFEFYRSFKLFDFEKKTNNISFSEYNALKFYIKNKPFKIIDCDKKIGSAILDHTLYNDLCLKHLDNRDNFFPLEENTLDQIIIDINETLTCLLDNNYISKRLFNNLHLKNCKVGSFRILAKLHKNIFDSRPIINCISHPTSGISIVVDSLLQPFVKLSESYLQDSQHLLQKLTDTSLPSNCELNSLDFSSLYQNIDLSHALTLLTDFMKDKISNFKPHILNIIAFHSFLDLVFKHNMF